MSGLSLCSVEGCLNRVQKDGHTLCYAHWKKDKQKIEEPNQEYVVNQKAPPAKELTNDYLNSTALGEQFGLNSKQTNRVLLELDWIEKDGKGWKPTVLGEKLRAQRQIHSVSKVPSVRWHRDICKSRILKNAASEFLANDAEASSNKTIPLPAEAADKTGEFRKKFPPTIRTSDGHMVRSRGEAMIDAWLYENRIVHAYEKLLVYAEQEMYCDFYLPQYDLYIEFWGLESDPKYKSRKEKKLEIYRGNELRLIEIKNEHIDNLDDYLTAKLSRFGLKS